MGAMLVTLTSDEYLDRVDNLWGFSPKMRGLVLEAKAIANEALDGILRRDGTPAIVHSRALALKAWEMGHSPEAQVMAWLHDVIEENNLITLWEIYCRLMPYYGPNTRIIYGVLALTCRKWMTDKIYFDRIYQRSILDWEVVAIKMIDRWHFHSDHYNGSVAKELRKLKQTRTIFRDTVLRCRPMVPVDFLPKYDQLLIDILELANDRRKVLKR